jgi:hypothetical protein
MDEHQSNDDSEKYFKFKRVHSGFLYSCLVRRIWECIPKLYYSSNFPDVSSLQIGVVSDVDESVNGIRDIYAKKAMLMFYPFKRKEDLYGCHDSLWDSLQEQNQKMIYGMTTDTTGYMLYIHYSIQNLQNIQDMLNVKKIPKKPVKRPIKIQVSVLRLATSLRHSASCGKHSVWVAPAP